ncbi:carboxylating nicotinate-nucleotide diphosphorylase [Pontibacillus yanchengensis]|uniref:Carboxylating nicotinate-nucleotide diphosphorylase n=2 Tax=Pontibacillus yanchengensis TaxID=462910 RepID=A0ACC7VHG2_9BACI|nr:carboxylating nicotinate-nucleotide diphosphorylase [Pontibacillus yanchengensis]MYL34545.1 carboxylating nicotinate-nucleotide diphosphorylase [Pontibacillus yanchengensis]MYL54413.1 carboxylating nicotinate-nucleotide diphosphorylase [Pontibacillus yanchengensis]
MNKIKLRQLIEQFYLEDIGEGDQTSNLLFESTTRGKVHFIAKETGIFCGTDVIEIGYELLTKDNAVHIFIQDGDQVEEGQIIATVEGPMSTLLTGERVILNVIQRMSGVATITKQAVLLLDSPYTRICDTRKTTPGLRMLEKYAVRMGGGFNHRNGLYDAVMIKDNHIAFAGSITKAVASLREQLGHMIKIEVETETEEQVREAVEAGVDCIMFDNRTPDEIEKFDKLVPISITTEASGGINLANLHTYRHTGVNYISLGCLTHSATALDISVRVEMQ